MALAALVVGAGACGARTPFDLGDPEAPPEAPDAGPSAPDGGATPGDPPLSADPIAGSDDAGAGLPSLDTGAGPPPVDAIAGPTPADASTGCPTSDTSLDGVCVPRPRPVLLPDAG